VRDRVDEAPRVYDLRDRDEHDPRNALMRDLDLPLGDERELVVDRDRVYELDREDSLALAAVGAFRVVPEHDLDLPHDTLESLQYQGLVELLDLGDSERGPTLTTEGRDLLDSHSLERDREPSQMFYACVNISKATLDGAFDELALLQPTPGYMRLVKDRILCVWERRRADAKDRTKEQQRRVSAIQQKLDKLDEAFLYAEAIDVTTYGRQRDKLREALTLAKLDHHAEAVEELDVEGILAFAERILPRASDLWVQASLGYKPRLQRCSSRKDRVRRKSILSTRRNGAFFNYLAASECEERVVSQISRVETSSTGGCGRSSAFDEQRECSDRALPLLRARGRLGASEWSRHCTSTRGRTCPEGLEQEFVVFLVASYVNDRDLADPEDGVVIVQAG
jgi:hypothetical protein